MKNKSLKRITAIAILFSMMFTGGIFAYWASNVNGDTQTSSPEIVIGVGEEVNTTLNLGEYQQTEGVLVPAGFEKQGSVSEIVVTYCVTLEATDLGSTGAVATLGVTYGALPNPLINVAINLSNQEIVAGGEPVEVTVTVTLDEPANVAEYEAVANMAFDLDLTFTATIN